MADPDPGTAPDEALLEQLRGLYTSVDEGLRRRWARSLAFEDALFDRWERARRLGFAEGVSIYNSAMILEPVSVGERTWIGPWALLDGSGGGISVGAWCCISAGVQVYTHDTVLWSLSAGQLPRREGPVSIGDRCYIGPMSIVVAGVTIGEGSVVGANSFVSRDVSPATVVAGSPAREIGRVEGEGVDVHIVMTGSGPPA